MPRRKRAAFEEESNTWPLATPTTRRNFLRQGWDEQTHDVATIWPRGNAVLGILIPSKQRKLIRSEGNTGSRSTSGAFAA